MDKQFFPIPPQRLTAGLVPVKLINKSVLWEGRLHMKIRNIIEPKRFFETVNTCHGHVELLTAEGDRLNLKSTLCQYIALTQMFQDGRVEGVELSLSDPSDLERLIEFLVTE